MSSKHLIIIAHGSRRETANQHFVKLADAIAQQLGNSYVKVYACFLEMVKPKLLDSIQEAINDGAQEIDIFPYFLGPGNHVLEDIPEILDHAKKEFKDCKFNQLDYFGSVSSMPQLVSQAING